MGEHGKIPNPSAKERQIANLRKGGGRPRGVPNKVTQEFRQTIQMLLDENRENVSKWIAEIALEDKDKALRHITNLAEFAAPKLNRTELTGDGGGPVQVTIQKIA